MLPRLVSLLLHPLRGRNSVPCLSSLPLGPPPRAAPGPALNRVPLEASTPPGVPRLLPQFGTHQSECVFDKEGNQRLFVKTKKMKESEPSSRPPSPPPLCKGSEVPAGLAQLVERHLQCSRDLS